MSTNTASEPWCRFCYRESAYRAASEHPDPQAGVIIRRTADARFEQGDPGRSVSLATHSRHPKRTRPWPSQAAAAA